MANDDTPAPDTDADSSRDAVSDPKPMKRRRPRLSTLAVVVAVLCGTAMATASSYMTWQHRQAADHQQRTAQYAAAARQIVVTLMSLDAAHAKDDVQRIIDSSTGGFRDEFQSAAPDFIKAAQDAKVSTQATVKAAAVESMTDDSAVVLVTATSENATTNGADAQPRSWRLSVAVAKDADQIKLSKIEFVP
jgi:Mce-associated membrane protein